ncbi:hypothetical protein PspLS_08546 [Pyricularia sp. CBS 133598]|nr:hypothetical protein PspLS_08546 [Pyricularia sp. CBS 133598]
MEQHFRRAATGMDNMLNNVLSMEPPPNTWGPAPSAAPVSQTSAEKTSQLLIRDYPFRSIAIVSKSHALVFRHGSSSHDPLSNGSFSALPNPRSRLGEGSSNAAKCMVEFAPNTRKLLDDYRPLTSRPIYGTLGLISMGQDVFICVITSASRVATLRPGETIERINAVEFFCLNTNEYDDVLSTDPYYEDDGSSAYGQGLSRRDPTMEHPCAEVQKLLSNGSFYFSTDFDLTNRLQDRPADASAFNIDNFDEEFLWNSFMIDPLVQFRSRLIAHEREALDASWFLTSAIRGFCQTITLPQPIAPLRGGSKAGMPSYLTLISRLSCRRAGTRFNSRGIDDDGNVANFVESETTYWSPSGVVFSYCQVRGSVPVFWEQSAGLIPGQQKITLTRSPDGTQPAFNKHFQDLEQTYGAVHVVNLLSATKPGELELTQSFRYGIQHCPLSRRGEKHSQQDHALLRATEYDFHAETKGPQGYEAAKQIRHYIENSADGFAYYLSEVTRDSEEVGRPSAPRYVVLLQQEGVFRTNCLDCLDRTNLIQTLISQMAVETFLGHRGEFATSDFWMRHSSMWADNGDALSRIYAGTGALKSSFTRHGKMSLAGTFADVRKSATRLYINNFADKGRQNTIDLLLGRIYGQAPVVLYDPISDYVAVELSKRSAQFSSTETISILVGTFNLNGRTEGIDEDLSPWLWPAALGDRQPEIVAVGFQEIVELSPQQIMNSDPRRKQLWENAVKQTLNENCERHGQEKYVLLRSGQLVGAALCIFVKASALRNIKNVEGNVKKTGMSGMAGNKGAVAIRLDYASTPICFVTAHLAAGFANYEERNKDYATIHQGLRFQRNRGIDDHDTVIWLGDFNYRIGLSRDKTMDLIKRQDLGRLYENDQLNLQMVAGLSFQYYSEARINFMPTYKFDLGNDVYDSSEKARIPAWTDRILRKGNNIRQTSYDSAPLRFSDHRPVYGTFDCTVNIVDEALREQFSREIYERRKADMGDAISIQTADTDDEDLKGYGSIEPGLPPASTDRQKWWLENGRTARSTVAPPRPTASSHVTVLNPNRPPNPFVPTEEPDWVTVPRSDSRLSNSYSSISTSPYEHVLPTLKQQQTVRKLPPPYDPSALSAQFTRRPTGQSDQHSASGLRNEMPSSALSAQFTRRPSTQSEHVSSSYRNQTPPPPPPPRRQPGNSGSGPGPERASTLPAKMPTKVLPPPSDVIPRKAVQAQPPPTSSASSTTKSSNAPPPVARKPAHLAGLSPAGSPTIAQSDHVAVAQRPRSPGRAEDGLKGVVGRLGERQQAMQQVSPLRGKDGGLARRPIASPPTASELGIDRAVESAAPPPKPSRKPTMSPEVRPKPKPPALRSEQTVVHDQSNQANQPHSRPVPHRPSATTQSSGGNTSLMDNDTDDQLSAFKVLRPS